MNTCPVTITNIETSCGSNMAGVSDVWIANFGAATFTFDYQLDEEGNQVLDADGNPIKSAILTATLAGDEWYKHFGFRKQTASMTTNLQVNDNGTNFWQTDLNIVFPKQDTNKRLSIMSLMQGESAALVKDNNGNYWYIGLNNSLSMSTGVAETGTSYSDNNAYTITLTDSDLIMPLPVSAAAVTTMTTPTTVADPVITASGNDVTMTCSTSDAKIYYTTDGTTPTYASSLYNGVVAITQTTTFKAVGIKAGLVNSDVVTENVVYSA